MKKKTNKTILVVISIVALIIIGCIIVFLQPSWHVLPIDRITGIYTSATLKPGCTITHGKPFLAYPDSVPKHNQPSEIPTEDEDPVLSVSDIRIIDVYGFNCSIIFIYNEDQQLYVVEDYPLSNLDYDVIEVLGANDGIKTDLKGTGYTLRGAPSQHLPRILVIIIPVILIVAAVLLGIRRAKEKYKKVKEQGW